MTEMLEAKICILLNQARVSAVSGNIESLLGYKADDFLTGKLSLQERIHKDDLDIAEQLFAKSIIPANGIFNLRIRQTNGRIRCLKTIYSKQSDQNSAEIILTLLLQDAKSLAQREQVLSADFKAMMDNTDDYIYFKDRNHVFTGASQSIVSITDPSEHWSDLLGQTDYDLFPEAYADVYYRLEKQLFAGIPVAHEVVATLDNLGNSGWVDNRKYPILNDKAEIIGLFGIARIVTENVKNQLKIQQLLNEQSAILENQLVGFATVKDRKIIWANPAFVNLFGYSKQELVNMLTRQFYIHQADYLAIGKDYAKIANGVVLYRELEFVHKNGHHVWIDLSGMMLNPKEDISLWSFVDVTELKHHTLALQNSETEFRTLFEANSDAVMLLDDTGFINCNQATLALFGCGSVDEFCTYTPAKLSPSEQTAGSRSDELAAQMIGICWARGSHSFEWLHKRLDDGRVFPVDVRLTAMELSGKQIVLALLRDISLQKQAEQELRIAAVAFNSMEGTTITDAEGVILKVNPAFSRITGYNAEEVIGQNPRVLQSGRHDADFYQTMWNSLINTGSWEGEIWNRRKDNNIYPEYLTISAVKDEQGKINNYVATFRDITLSKASAEEIERLAFYDPLTKLPNRRLMLNRLTPALACSARNGKKGALLFIDLDNFKTLNDNYGHDKGDVLLQQVAERLLLCIREGDTVARLGGDEFVVMLTDLSADQLDSAALVEMIGNKILMQLNKPYLLGELIYHSTSSIGATLFTGHEQKVEALLKHADIAMYEAKTAGRNTLRFYDQQMQADIAARVQLEEELRLALLDNQFRLYYQPQVIDRLIIGAEALIRWEHPQHGLRQPLDFIPLAEENGLIVPIGQWVLDSACAQIKAWESHPQMEHLQLAVNVSLRQFRQADFVERVSCIIQHYAIRPHRLKLEITESQLMENIDDAIEKIRALRELGVRFSMDDFGTGYSSLASLKKLPIDQLKIDRSFVKDILQNDDDMIIVQTIIAMANKMHLEVIAEGVETEYQRDFLIHNGCNLHQGYLYGKPMSLVSFKQLLIESINDKSLLSKKTMPEF
ncbi:MAG: EAL domain-containing protein [Methylomonas lenta]|nr:EAL domain-containing protein [Methylomonas lenta]